MQPSEWELASNALAAAIPRDSIEASAKTKLGVDLATALRIFMASVFPHARLPDATAKELQEIAREIEANSPHEEHTNPLGLRYAPHSHTEDE